LLFKISNTKSQIQEKVKGESSREKGIRRKEKGESKKEKG